MKFPYSKVIWGTTAEGDFVLLQRPEIPIAITGPGGQMSLIGLVDTGSDRTIFPMSAARKLQIPTEVEIGPSIKAFGGHKIQLFAGEALLELKSDGEAIAWRSPIWFFDFQDEQDEAVILGHAGFLDYFTATFDGLNAVLTLEPNAELPDAAERG